MKFKDSRLKIMNEILNGIKVSASIHILISIAGKINHPLNRLYVGPEKLLCLWLWILVIQPFSSTFIFHVVPPDPKAVRVGAVFPSPGGRHQGE